MSLLLSVLGKAEAIAQGIHRLAWREAGDHGLPNQSRTRKQLKQTKPTLPVSRVGCPILNGKTEDKEGTSGVKSHV